MLVSLLQSITNNLSRIFMKILSFIFNLRRLLILSIVAMCTHAFSQTILGEDPKAKKISFDFLGCDLIKKSPYELDELNLVYDRSEQHLKGAILKPARLDSILEVSNYGAYTDHCKWQFEYDDSDQLKSSSRIFLDVNDKFKNKSESTLYDNKVKV